MTGPASRVAVCIGRWMPIEIRSRQARLLESIFRSVDTLDHPPVAAQPRCGRSQAERLATELVGRNQQRPHRPDHSDIAVW